jgi:EpsD family peptidyl-prolyl cis-trans isomerase
MNLRKASSTALALACTAALLAACGKKNPDTSAVLATVNKETITQDQLDYARKQVAAAHPGASQPEAAQILQGLVEQRLAVQKAEKDKLDRNPGVLQALESARKDALARYYAEQLVAKVPKPTEDEIKQFYDARPANFAQRGIYTIQKVDARVAPDQARDVAMGAQAAGSAADVVTLLKAKATGTNVSQTQVPAEALGPLLGRVSALKPGQTIALPQPQGLTALTLVAVQPQPVSLEQAHASIEQAVWNQKKREALQAETKALRAAARIEYLGKFGAGAIPASGASAAVASPASAASQ